jgi:hypothetical protein
MKSVPDFDDRNFDASFPGRAGKEGLAKLKNIKP